MDSEWPDELSGGVAILGDSFLAAEQVDSDKAAAMKLREKLDVPLINAAISSFGTVSELETYKKYVREKDPSLVILFAYPSNDISDNNCAYRYVNETQVNKVCGELKNGELSVNKNLHVPEPETNPIKLLIRDQCYVCKLAGNAFEKFTQKTERTHFRELNKTYFPYTSPEMRDAVTITELALKELKREIEQDGSNFLVVTIPSFRATARDWIEEENFTDMDPDTFEGFDAYRPIATFVGMLKDNDIEYLDLTEHFIKYRDEHDLQYPYFSFTCDGHWNELGNELAAELVAEYIQAHGLLATSTNDAFTFAD